jgi:hypothetical protein
VKRVWWLLFLVAAVPLLSLPSCLETQSDHRKQDLQVVTEPEGATVWVEDGEGRRTLGPAPLTVTASYEMEVVSFGRWMWAGVPLLGVLYGFLCWLLSYRDGWRHLAGLVGSQLCLVAFIVLFVACLYGESQSGEFLPGHAQGMTLGASADGHGPDTTSVSLPHDRSEIRLVLPSENSGSDPEGR